MLASFFCTIIYVVVFYLRESCRNRTGS